MVSEWAVGMAGAVLAKAATLRPASVPNDLTEEVVTAWAECVDMMQRPKITDLWKEAVTRWAMSAPDGMFTPYALRCSVDEMLEVWRHDPKRCDELDRYRYEMVRGRVQRGELPPGTEDGYLPDSMTGDRQVTGPSDGRKTRIDALNFGAA